MVCAKPSHAIIYIDLCVGPAVECVNAAFRKMEFLDRWDSTKLILKPTRADAELAREPETKQRIPG